SGIKADAAPRSLSSDLYFDEDDPDKRFRVKTKGLKIAIQDEQVEFYLQAQRNVLALFQNSDVILSSQPLMYENSVSGVYRKAFAPEGTEADQAALIRDLDRYMVENGARDCRPEAQLLHYFMGRSALGLKKLGASTQQESQSRRVVALNTEAALPLA